MAIVGVALMWSHAAIEIQGLDVVAPHHKWLAGPLELRAHCDCLGRHHKGASAIVDHGYINHIACPIACHDTAIQAKTVIGR